MATLSEPSNSDDLLVAFDDAGNTGQNLLDPAQPVFVLASVRMDTAAAGELAAHARGPRLAEAKFAQLRRRESGRARLLEVLRSDALAPEHVRVAVYHKPFLVTTFLVDLLIEPLAHATGHDLYENRGNLALANLLQSVIDAFCGPGALLELHRRFVAAAMAKTPPEATAAVAAFYEYVQSLRESNVEPGFDDTLGMIAATRMIAPAWVGQCDPVALDPAVPAFADLASQWTAALGRPFTIAHDRSKPIEHMQEVLEGLMRTEGETQTFAKNVVPRAWPILAQGIQFHDSHAVPQIQIADLLAGSFATILGARACRGGSPEEEEFVRALLDTCVNEIAFDPIWPSRIVDPAELGPDRGNASAAIDFVGELAREASARRAAKA